jgi:sugar O-acyltransferase (sialic acid O-acetyltransferase NeuD family)
MSVARFNRMAMRPIIRRDAAVLDPIKVVIIGAKSPQTGRVMAAIVRANKAEGHPRQVFHGFIDNDIERQRAKFCGLPVFGGFEKLDELIAEDCRFVSTITGSTLSRYEAARTVRDRGGLFVNLIDPSSDHADTIGAGNYIQENVRIQAGASIGDTSSIHVGSIVSHETQIGNSSFLAPGASVAGEVVIGDGVFIGINATLLPRISIGNWATIGAGAVVLHDVPPYAIVAGNPARILGENLQKYSDGKI